MKDQLSHSEIERLIDEQERELDYLIQEENHKDEVEGRYCESTISNEVSKKNCLKDVWESLVRHFRSYF